MSCCNTNRPVIVYPPCTAACPEPDAVVAQNNNTLGFGVLDYQDGQTLYFLGIAPGEYTTVTIDPESKALVIDIDPALIDGSIPNASETVSGKIQLATHAEVESGFNADKAITPARLAAMFSTTARRGLIETATVVEAEEGILSDVAVTPEGLAAAIAAQKQVAVFANAAARAAGSPSYVGQLALQLDTGTIYRSYGLLVGEWYGVNLDAPSIVNTVNFIGTTWQINSVAIPANSVVITSGTAGVPSSKLISDFLSTSSDIREYVISNATGTLRDYDVSTVTVAQLADVVCTLIGDLSFLRRPIPA